MTAKISKDETVNVTISTNTFLVKWKKESFEKLIQKATLKKGERQKEFLRMIVTDYMRKRKNVIATGKDWEESAEDIVKKIGEQVQGD